MAGRDFDVLVNRLMDRLRTAPIDEEPCENIFLEEVFPDAVYIEMLRRLPDDGALEDLDHPDAITLEGRRTRKLLDLTEASLSRLREDDRPFWARMIGVLSSAELLAALVEKFRTTLNERFAGNLPEMVAVPLLYRDYPGYFIRIHPDSPGKLITLQFYLPADNSQIHLGTTFHRRTETGFEELKTNEFKPNSAYAFVRTDESWHSVKKLGSNERKRNTIALTVYMRGQEYVSTRKAA
jgi:hypothetical protein